MIITVAESPLPTGDVLVITETPLLISSIFAEADAVAVGFEVVFAGVLSVFVPLTVVLFCLSVLFTVWRSVVLSL